MSETTNRQRHGASLRCEVKGCMGNPKPKDIKEAETFCGSICTKCFAVYDYVNLKVQEVEIKTKQKEQKIKDKTLTTSEADVERLIAEADGKNTQKEVKSNKGEQLGLF